MILKTVFHVQDRPGQAQAALWHRASNFLKKEKKTCTYGQNQSLNVTFSEDKSLEDINFVVNYELSVSKGLFIGK